MNRVLYVLSAAASVVWAAGAQAAELPPEVDAAFAHYTALAEELVPVLQAAQDAQSAGEAAPQLEKLLSKVMDAKRELDEIKELPPEVAAEVRRKYEQKMRSNWGRVYDEVYRLQSVRCYENVPFFKNFRTLCVFLNQ